MHAKTVRERDKRRRSRNATENSVLFTWVRPGKWKIEKRLLSLSDDCFTRRITCCMHDADVKSVATQHVPTALHGTLFVELGCTRLILLSNLDKTKKPIFHLRMPSVTKTIVNVPLYKFVQNFSGKVSFHRNGYNFPEMACETEAGCFWVWVSFLPSH